ncbi:N-acetylmuramoyl-L-alanine amidase [Listeria aquatica]|uniref:N-acetylmuramoyl-L-alanine amidase n=1 Tax=Listeria aquatica TaxID=1494960 RepID=UPI003EF5D9E9
MKKLTTLFLAALMTVSVALPASAAVDIKKQHISSVPKMAYKNGIGKPQVIVLHETANNNASIENEVSYMSRNWQNAFVHAFVSDKRAIEIADTNYSAWGAGPEANKIGIHVELVRKGNFKQAYNNWLDTAVYYAKQYKIPMRFNAGKSGFVTHAYVTNHWGGTSHQDPVAWLKQNGVSMGQLEKDLKAKYNKGTSVDVSTPPVTHTPAPNVPSNLKVGAKVKVLASAKTYASGQRIPQFIKGRNYTIVQTKAERVRLKEINSWVYNRDVEVLKAPVVVVKPKPNYKKPNRQYAEKGIYTANTTVAIKYSPFVRANQVARLTPGESVHYRRVAFSDGYVWVQYMRSIGRLAWACAGQASADNSKNADKYGTFK